MGHAAFKRRVCLACILGHVCEHRQPDAHSAGIMAVCLVDPAVSIDLCPEQLGWLVSRKGEDRPAKLAITEKRGIADRRPPTGDRALYRPGPDGDALTLE